MKQGFSLAFAQNLSLTPALQQAIKLLQLPTTQLLEELHAQVQDNPFLILDAPVHHDRIAANGTVSGLYHRASSLPDRGVDDNTATTGEVRATSPDYSPNSHDDSPPSSDSTEHSHDWNTPLNASPTAPRDAHDDAGDYLGWIAASPTTLREHLHAQARCLPAHRADAVTLGVLGLLIDSLQSTGYFGEPLTALLAIIAAHCDIPNDHALHDAVGSALPLLHALDPPGIGAFDLQHCLQLQLRHSSPPECVLDAKVTTHTAALRVVEQGFSSLAGRDRVALKKLLACDDGALDRVLSLIRQLDPKPGLVFAPEAVEYALPELLVVLHQGAWQARLNPATVPPLRLAKTHAQYLQENHKRKKTAPQFADLHAKLQDAKQWVRTVQQHFDTVFRVGQAIVAAQQDFFHHGAMDLKPMVLREIADVLGLHESTISRVTQNKYLQSAHGVFELKYFFSSKLIQDDGTNTSSTAIKAHLLKLLQGEPTHKPLSDQALTDTLNAAGHTLARRTVAKYREQLGYGPAHARKPF